jgi:hypothetical protein
MLSAGLLALTCLSSAADEKDNPLSEPKKSIEHQLKLIKDGDADKLKACFTARQQPNITKEAVAAAQKQVGKVTIDDLVKTVTTAERGGVKTAKITMKNGRTLTTLILTDGKWLADTIWFK